MHELPPDMEGSEDSCSDQELSFIEQADDEMVKRIEQRLAKHLVKNQGEPSANDSADVNQSNSIVVQKGNANIRVTEVTNQNVSDLRQRVTNMDCRESVASRSDEYINLANAWRKSITPERETSRVSFDLSNSGGSTPLNRSRSRSRSPTPALKRKKQEKTPSKRAEPQESSAEEGEITDLDDDDFGMLLDENDEEIYPIHSELGKRRSGQFPRGNISIWLNSCLMTIIRKIRN